MHMYVQDPTIATPTNYHVLVDPDALAANPLNGDREHGVFLHGTTVSLGEFRDDNMGVALQQRQEELRIWSGKYLWV